LHVGDQEVDQGTPATVLDTRIGSLPARSGQHPRKVDVRADKVAPTPGITSCRADHAGSTGDLEEAVTSSEPVAVNEPCSHRLAGICHGIAAIPDDRFVNQAPSPSACSTDGSGA
jgi:hypothetical protein